MQIDIDLDTQTEITIATLKEWYEDAMLDNDIGTVLAAILRTIEYGSIPEEFREWRSSLD